MKYEVLTTCHVGGRYCKKGENGEVNIVDLASNLDSPYLKKVSNFVKVTKPIKQGKALKSLGKKPEITTGMAAKRKTKD